MSSPKTFDEDEFYEDLTKRGLEGEDPVPYAFKAGQRSRDEEVEKLEDEVWECHGGAGDGPCWDEKYREGPPELHSEACPTCVRVHERKKA